MRDELDKKLVAKYSLLFKDRYGNLPDLTKAWGFECGDGWFDIIDNLCFALMSSYRRATVELESATKYLGQNELWTNERLEAAKTKLSDLEQQLPTVEQVKEKFGSLRFYVNKGTDADYGLIEFAENMSSCTCEVCGNKGTEYPLGWIKTLCRQHAMEKYGETKLLDFEKKKAVLTSES